METTPPAFGFGGVFDSGSGECRNTALSRDHPAGSADPDVSAFALPAFDQSIRADFLPLPGTISPLGKPGREQVHRDPGIEAASHGVLDKPSNRIGKEGAQFPITPSAPGMGTGKPDIGPQGCLARRFCRQHCRGAIEA